MHTLDGNYSLAETESAIQAKEAAGRELTKLRVGNTNPPTNEADFNNLPGGKRPDDFKLTLQNVPVGKSQVWAGEIYVKGKVQKAKGYRDVAQHDPAEE